MFKKRLILSLIALSLWTLSFGVQREFAIIVDQETYAACKAEIEGYRALLKSEGLSAVVVAKEWSNPVEVKDHLYKMYLSQGLEGAVFVGAIPIAMIRDAQHLTSAFKMDQEQYSFMDSSVPSDRFYDDFDLKFNYLGPDSKDSLFHFYSLKADSPQRISCDIYSGRIKPTREGEEGYAQIRDYFKKLLVEREQKNRLDVITSYTGEGSFSNSLTAWKDEGHVFKEQFPNAYKKGNSVKFLFFSMYPYMKDLVIEELRRDEMDLMLFHEHGMPDRQYLTGVPDAEGASAQSETARALFRSSLRRVSDPEKRELAKRGWMEYYNIDSTWFDGAFTSEQKKKDSLLDLRTGIILEDVPVIKPNARVVVFDACYNGDFREEKFIAGEYLFGGGKTLVSFGNSVNVLQDKSSSDLMGMLALGFSVGEWAQQINILESHIIGDPTFRFKGETRPDVDLKSKEISYWLSFVDHKESALQGLALHKLFELNYSKMPQLLVDTYYSSPYYTVRLQVYHLLQFYRGSYFSDLLENSAFDPYEFIRRKSVFSMGRIGSDKFIPYIVSIYLNDYLDKRVFFNATFCFDMLDTDKLEAEFRKQLDANSSYTNKEKIWSEFKRSLDSRKSIYRMANAITDKEKSLKARVGAVRMLRNNAYHNSVNEYLTVLKDRSEDISLRVALAEALGWFTISHEREAIVEACKEIAADTSESETIRDEAFKCAARIEVYMR
ncbi:MAG: hypothetical protein PHR40_04110 [Bacteroidales bacterium]|nr:hypothetical protein [Bacteroidales bacterium]